MPLLNSGFGITYYWFETASRGCSDGLAEPALQAIPSVRQLEQGVVLSHRICQ